MIISEKNNYVFVSTPKTGSHTMFKILQEQYDGVRYGPSNGYNFHEWVTPVQYKNYFHFSTVRNPYTRFVALWWSLLMVGKGSESRTSI